VDKLGNKLKVLRSALEVAENIVKTVREPMLVLDTELRVISASHSFCQTYKVTYEETVGQLIYDLGNRQWDIPKMRELLEHVLPTNTAFIDYEVEHNFESIGRRTMLLNAKKIYSGANKAEMILLAIEDITAHKRTEELLRLSNRFLRIANRHVELSPLLKEFVVEIQNFTGCAAVGLRILDEKGNIPYKAYAGFSNIFYESESPLSINSDQCMCINVIKGVTDSKRSFYTKGGSFYMNGTTRFLSTVSEEEKGRTRNVCNQVGYESVALIPIHTEGRIIGLIHVADHRENMVPLDVVDVLEKVAMQLGTAIQRVRTDEQIIQSKKDWQETFDTIPDLITIHDENFNILYANKTAKKVLNLPELETNNPVKCYKYYHGLDSPPEGCPSCECLKTKKSAVSEMFEPHLNRSVEIRALPRFDGDGKLIRLVHVVRDITEREEDGKEIQKLLTDVSMANEELEGLFTNVVKTMVNALDAKSTWTKGHSDRVAQYAEMTAAKMGFSEEETKRLWLAGILHDIGKLGTYDKLLDKTGELTKEEFELVKKHPVQGGKIIEDIRQWRDIIPYIRHHHERLDGKGYPDSLKGEEIPIQARILHVVDSFDSMTSDRPYRQGQSIDYIISEFKKHSGTQFDSKVVEAFLEVLKEQGKIKY
jgi:putative nucleotidyltransferase with HDIG domain/PAS domain S-box-containing protein